MQYYIVAAYHSWNHSQVWEHLHTRECPFSVE